MIPDVNVCGEIRSISNTITKKQNKTYFNARNKMALVLVWWETKTGLELYKSVREGSKCRNYPVLTSGGSDKK